MTPNFFDLTDSSQKAQLCSRKQQQQHTNYNLLLKRTPYADTFKYIEILKPRQVRFQDNFYNLDHILYSHTCCEWVFYIRDFNNKHVALLYLPIFPPQATPKLSKVLYTDIVYTVNLDAIPASYDIKDIKELLGLDEQYQQIVKQQQRNK